MVVANKVVLWIFPSHTLKKGSNVLDGNTYVKVDKKDLPVLDPGGTYVLDVAPYNFGHNTATFSTANVDIHTIEYHEAEGGYYLLTCVANPRGYAGLCSTYGETKA